MKRLRRRKLLSILMAPALVLSFVVAPGMSTVAAEADETEDAESETEAWEEDTEAEQETEEEPDEDGIMLLASSVPFVDENGNSLTVSSATFVISSSTSWSGWYVVDSDVTISSLVNVSGTTNLILADDCTLTASGGIEVDSGKTLNIYGQSGGTVTATGGWRGAGIGGGESGRGGDITINGGTVTANGGSNGAGIGGGSKRGHAAYPLRHEPDHRKRHYSYEFGNGVSGLGKHLHENR